DLKTSALDMVVAGNRDAVLMVESEAKELPEDLMLGAVLFAHQEMQAAIQVIDQLVSEVGKPRWDWQAASANVELTQALKNAVAGRLEDAYQVTDKQARVNQINALRAEAVESLANDDAGISAEDVSDAFKKLEKKIVRGRIIAGQPRIDGRDNRTVRPISIQVGILPKVHGTRSEEHTSELQSRENL